MIAEIAVNASTNRSNDMDACLPLADVVVPPQIADSPLLVGTCGGTRS